MAAEECAVHHQKEKKEKRYQTIYCFIIGIFFTAGLIVLITWLVLNPKNPRFMIQDATFYNFSVTSSPDLFTCVFQVTIISHNPNDRLGIYYENLKASAHYRDQIISLPTSIPPTYQGHHDSNIWSPFIEGISTPISPYNVYALNQDQASGAIPMTIKINGDLMWKALSRKFSNKGLHVTCRALIPYGSEIRDSLAAGTRTSIKYPLSVNCRVDV
ncbi:hypothetical protein AgCh_000224 [Apium graveolens]